MLILLMDKLPVLRKFYSLFFGKISISSNNSDGDIVETEKEEAKQTDIFHEVASIFGKKSGDEEDGGESADTQSESPNQAPDADFTNNSPSDNYTVDDEN